jgi:hypothetical protein
VRDQNDANAIELTFNLGRLDCAATDDARSAGTSMGFGYAIEQGQAAIRQPGTDLSSQRIVRGCRHRGGGSVLRFVLAKRAWAARAKRRFARFFSRAFSRASACFCFLAVSRRPAKCAASAASIF